jgi:hypothetical protein
MTDRALFFSRLLDLIWSPPTFITVSLLLAALSGLTTSGYTTAVYSLVPAMFPNDIGKSSVRQKKSISESIWY